MTDAQKILISIVATLCTAAIISSAKAIVDVQVLKAEHLSVKEMLHDAKEERNIISDDIKTILQKL